MIFGLVFRPIDIMYICSLYVCTACSSTPFTIISAEKKLCVLDSSLGVKLSQSFTRLPWLNCEFKLLRDN